MMSAVGCNGIPHRPMPLEIQNSRCPGIAVTDVDFWRNLSVGRSATSGESGAPTEAAAVSALRIPVAVAAHVNDVYIADAGHRAVLRYDLATDIITRFAALTGAVSQVDLFVADDATVYVADAAGGRVLHYTREGRLLGAVRDERNLSRPVAVVSDRFRGNIVVGDGLQAHALVFNAFGSLVGGIGARLGSGIRFDSVAGLAVADGRLYVLDRAEREVHVLDWDGGYITHFGGDVLRSPISIAVDDDQRVFVAERYDNTVRIFTDGEYEKRVTGAAPSRPFAEIADIWVDARFLYVASPGNSQVSVFAVSERCS